jgi:hypothetical protein
LPTIVTNVPATYLPTEMTQVPSIMTTQQQHHLQLKYNPQ